MLLKFNKYNINVRINHKVGSNQNFVLIHGFAVDNREMIRVSKGLPGNTYLIDLIEHGKSTINSSSTVLDYELFVDSILDVIKRLKLGNITIIGHSLGSLFALVVASKCQNIKQLVLISMPRVEIANDQALIDKLLSTDKKVIHDLTVNYLFYKPSPLMTKFVCWLIHRKNIKNRNKYSRVVNDLKKSIDQKTFVSYLKNIKVPTLIISGEKDPISTFDSLKFITSNIKIKHKLVIIPNARHSVCLQQNKEVINIITKNNLK